MLILCSSRSSCLHQVCVLEGDRAREGFETLPPSDYCKEQAVLVCSQ